MLVVGFTLLATKSVDLHIKTLLKASIVFVIMLAIALTLNIVWHYCGNEETFNNIQCCTIPYIFNIVYIGILVGWTYNTIHSYRNRQTNNID